MEMEARVQQLEGRPDAALCAKVDRCLRGYVEWEIQTLKWTKLSELERRVKELTVSGVVGQRKLSRKLNSFISGFEKMNENIYLELYVILSRIGIDMSSTGVVTVVSASVALVGGSPLSG